MNICSTIAAMRAACRTARDSVRAGGRLGLVPTMGALHGGHLSLVRLARQRCASVAVSIFVNPTQFGPQEDLARYPRTFERDCALLEAEGVDLLFAPSAEEMYPPANQGTMVEVPGLSDRLDGRSRPGHFRGVATVVTKLLNIVAPDEVFFGQKDAAQVAVLRAMVADLNFDVQLTTGPTVREPDGLAMSSRNRFLGPGRKQAAALSQALEAVRQSPETDPLTLRNLLQQRLGSLDLEYAEIVDPCTLEPVEDLRAGALVALAARIDGVRLIDNILLPPGLDKEAETR